MKKIFLITIGALLILATGAALFIDAYKVENQVSSNNEPLSENLIQEEMQLENKESLEGSWTWSFSEDESGEIVEPNSSDDFVMTISDVNGEWRISSTTDCNVVSGSFEKNEQDVSLSPLAMTKKACLNETQEGLYVAQLSLFSSYEIKEDMLYITLSDDAGTMVFARK